ncbi:MAG: RNA polymerase sigma factor [Candidatus Omnitrophota bacterium]|nr:RNA polymerase sigma factor [Candidatus Omnitrophota bacterium]
MQPIPEEIIIKASEGDMHAFEEIYRRASGYVYTIAFRVTGRREDAQEVTQDVFVSVYRNLSKFRFKSSFKTWIYRITTNKAINVYRKRSKERARTVAFDDAIDAGPVQETGTDLLEKEHSQDLVRSMLNSLPDEQRACLVLKEIEGLKYEEIAETLNIKINTVRTRLKRAREKLISRYRKRG